MFELDEVSFKEWFKEVSNEKAEFRTTRLRAWEFMEELVANEEDPYFELAAEFTRSGEVETYSQ